MHKSLLTISLYDAALKVKKKKAFHCIPSKPKQNIYVNINKVQTVKQVPVVKISIAV